MENKVGTIFPKLFIGDAMYAFKKFIEKNKLPYSINFISTNEELVDFIETYSNYSNYNYPVIIADISYFNKSTQSLLLKFIDNSNLNIILLASRDNILDTIISRVKEFRKYYIQKSVDSINYLSLSKAREFFKNDKELDESLSYDDKLYLYNKYNPILSYNDNLVKLHSYNDRDKLVTLLEYTNE